MKLCGLFLSVACFGLVAQDKVSWIDRPVGVKQVVAANGAMWDGAGLDVGTSWKQPERNGLLAGADGKFGVKGLGIKVGINGAVTVVTVIMAKKWPKTRRAMMLMNGVAGGVQGLAGVSNLAR